MNEAVTTAEIEAVSSWTTYIVQFLPLTGSLIIASIILWQMRINRRSIQLDYLVKFRDRYSNDSFQDAMFALRRLSEVEEDWLDKWADDARRGKEEAKNLDQCRRRLRAFEHSIAIAVQNGALPKEFAAEIFTPAYIHVSKNILRPMTRAWYPDETWEKDDVRDRVLDEIFEDV